MNISDIRPGRTLDRRGRHQKQPWDNGRTLIDLYHEWAPPNAWQHAVVCRWERQVAAERTQRVVPDGCADLLIYESGLMNVAGIADQVALVLLPAGTRIQGIRFRPEAIATLFSLDASQLRNATTSLADVIGAKSAHRLSDACALDRWIRQAVPDRRVATAIALLKERPIGDVAITIGTSTRQLQRLVRTHTGLTPKQYQRVARFQRFLTYSNGTGLAGAAVAAGYSDQAHMTREVRRLTRLSPTSLLQSPK